MPRRISSSRRPRCGRAATRGAGGRQPAYMGELERLADLRDQGILTPEEFEAKKKQILGI